MARTWTLADSNTDTDRIADFLNTGTFDGNYLYFSTSGTGDPIIYRWSPSDGFEALSTTEFSGLSPAYMTVFNSELYVSALDANYIYVYRYSGAAWSQVLDIARAELFMSGPFLDSDNDRIVLIVNYQTETDVVYASINGTSWTQQTLDNGDFDLGNEVYGRARRTASEVLISQGAGGDIIAHSSGNNWTALNASATTYRFIGEADDKSWFIPESADPAEYSTDWGVNTTAAGGVDIDGGEVQTLDSDIQLAYDEDVFIYDPDTIAWAADGTPNPGNQVLLLAAIDGEIYALVQNGDDSEIWAGGALTPLPMAQFYQGAGSLTYRSDLPFAGVAVGALMVRTAGDVFAGSRAAGEILVARAGSNDAYATWVDLTGSLDQAKAIKGLATT